MNEAPQTVTANRVERASKKRPDTDPADRRPHRARRRRRPRDPAPARRRGADPRQRGEAGPSVRLHRQALGRRRDGRRRRRPGTPAEAEAVGTEITPTNRRPATNVHDVNWESGDYEEAFAAFTPDAAAAAEQNLDSLTLGATAGDDFESGRPGQGGPVLRSAVRPRREPGHRRGFGQVHRHRRTDRRDVRPDRERGQYFLQDLDGWQITAFDVTGPDEETEPPSPSVSPPPPHDAAILAPADRARGRPSGRLGRRVGARRRAGQGPPRGRAAVPLEPAHASASRSRRLGADLRPLVGSDARPGENIAETRADSLHILAINPAKAKATIVGIPDSYVDIPGRGQDKINSAMFYVDRSSSSRPSRS